MHDFKRAVISPQMRNNGICRKKKGNENEFFTKTKILEKAFADRNVCDDVVFDNTVSGVYTGFSCIGL